MKNRIITILALLMLAFAPPTWGVEPAEGIVVADCRLADYLPLLEGKRVGLLTNHTAVVEGTHLFLRPNTDLGARPRRARVCARATTNIRA